MSSRTALGGGIDCANSPLSLTGSTVNANRANGATAEVAGLLRPSVQHTSARTATSPICCGHIARRAQADLRNLLRPDTPMSVRVETFGAEVFSTSASNGQAKREPRRNLVRE
jgi:hypothetical protein